MIGRDIIAIETARIPARVQRGVRVFDAVVRGWRERVDRDTIDMSEEHTSVAVQATGAANYAAALDMVGIEFDPDHVTAAEVEFGLAAPEWFRRTVEDTVPYYTILTMAWKIVVLRGPGSDRTDD